jgi:hypothetical protein
MPTRSHLDYRSMKVVVAPLNTKESEQDKQGRIAVQAQHIVYKPS